MLPEHLSVTQVTTWLACPRKYRFRYVEKREAEEKSADMALGAAVHSAIEWWQTQRIQGGTPTVEEAQRLFRVDWQAQGMLGDLSFDEGDTADSLGKLGEELVKLLVERLSGEPVPEAVELRFTVPLRDRSGEELPVPLIGYFDLVEDGLVSEIKTCARKTSASNWALQLAAYAYARRETTGVRPKLRVIELIKTKVPKIEVEPYTVSDRDEAWFVEVAVEVFDAICLGAFPPNPGWMCPRCEFRRACKGA